MEDGSLPVPYLPPNVISVIAQHLWRGDRAVLFDVMALAGVCLAWREVVSLVPRNSENARICLNLNCLETAQPLSKRAAQFRRASLASQRAFLSSAARLLHGPGLFGISVRGSGGSDSLVLQVSPLCGAVLATLNVHWQVITYSKSACR